MKELKNRRQQLYWRLFGSLFSQEENPISEQLSAEILKEQGIPELLLSPSISIDNIIQRYPELEAEFNTLTKGMDEASESENRGDDKDEEETNRNELLRAAIYSKLLLNLYGEIHSGSVSAEQFSRWNQDRKWMERAFGHSPQSTEKEIKAGLKEMEGDIIKRMRLREVLANNQLAKQLTPSMSLVEQLLRDKSNLSDVALQNAKRLIQRFVNEVAEVLKTQVEQTTVGEIDRSVPPKRVFRNLDLKKTIWKNLINWDPNDQRLYVDQLFYQHSSRKTAPSRLIIVVDQSGSMVDSMVNCTILASIFAGLPKVDPHLIAYDTQAIDLTPWVYDPFEVLMRTNLGGGTDGTVAMTIAQPKISDPRNTVMVWISDFYEWKSQELFNRFKAIKESGVKFIPVGSVNSSNYQSVDPWFKTRFKELGCPVISGKIDKLIFELKKFLI